MATQLPSTRGFWCSNLHCGLLQVSISCIAGPSSFRCFTKDQNNSKIGPNGLEFWKVERCRCAGFQHRALVELREDYKRGLLLSGRGRSKDGDERRKCISQGHSNCGALDRHYSKSKQDSGLLSNICSCAFQRRGLEEWRKLSPGNTT